MPAPVFAQPTYCRFALLLAAAILTQGRRTVDNLLRTLGCLGPGHRSAYRRVPSRAPWSDLKLGYGNDSRQNGPLAPRVLHTAGDRSPGGAGVVAVPRAVQPGVFPP